MWALCGVINCSIGVQNPVQLFKRKGRDDGSSLQKITDFNNFIVEMELFDVLISGKKFSYICSDGISMSRLDRFLIT